jgi:hypothetical protein
MQKYVQCKQGRCKLLAHTPMTDDTGLLAAALLDRRRRAVTVIYGVYVSGS